MYQSTPTPVHTHTCVYTPVYSSAPISTLLYKYSQHSCDHLQLLIIQMAITVCVSLIPQTLHHYYTYSSYSHSSLYQTTFHQTVQKTKSNKCYQCCYVTKGLNTQTTQKSLSSKILIPDRMFKLDQPKLVKQPP